MSYNDAKVSVPLLKDEIRGNYNMYSSFSTSSEREKVENSLKICGMDSIKTSDISKITYRGKAIYIREK